MLKMSLFFMTVLFTVVSSGVVVACCWAHSGYDSAKCSALWPLTTSPVAPCEQRSGFPAQYCATLSEQDNSVGAESMFSAPAMPNWSGDSVSILTECKVQGNRQGCKHQKPDNQSLGVVDAAHIF